MHWRSFIREGDTVYPGGGEVRSGSNGLRVTYDGRNGCFEGDPVFCNTCKTLGVTQCVPPYRPCTAPDGRQANLDGDLCICKCPIPPRLKALASNNRMSFQEFGIAGRSEVIPWRVYMGHFTDDHEIFYEIVDAETDLPIRNMNYKLESNDVTLVDGQKMTDGVSRPQLINSFPGMCFAAWCDGKTR